MGSIRNVLICGVCFLACVCAVGIVVVQAAAAAQQTADGIVTFTRDVAPVLQEHCQVCHRPGSIAPMSLLTYEDVRPWARAIKAQLAKRAMPPWTLDRTVGIQEMKEDRSLSDEAIATIVKWVDSGAPRGDPVDMPPPRQFSDASKWTIGEPDLIIPIPEPYVVDPKQPNAWVDFWVDVADFGITEDRWIKAVETKPSLEGFPVVHHASTWMYNDAWPENMQGQRLGEYAVGKMADIFPEGTGRLLQAGTRIRFNLHYSAIGERTTDRTSVGLKLYPKEYVPKYKVEFHIVGMMQDLDLPPGESDIRHDGYTVLTENVRMTVYQPHLHNRGKRQCLEAIYPGGRIETLNCVNWDFGWHIPYNYKDHVQPLLPKGTILHVITWHDNSVANKWNPDPRNWVGWGNRSSDDMAFAHISWYSLADEEFAEHVRERLGDNRKIE